MINEKIIESRRAEEITKIFLLKNKDLIIKNGHPNFDFEIKNINFPGKKINIEVKASKYNWDKIVTMTKNRIKNIEFLELPILLININVDTEKGLFGILTEKKNDRYFLKRKVNSYQLESEIFQKKIAEIF